MNRVGMLAHRRRRLERGADRCSRRVGHAGEAAWDCGAVDPVGRHAHQGVLTEGWADGMLFAW